jgi:hypothetical protein
MRMTDLNPRHPDHRSFGAAVVGEIMLGSHSIALNGPGFVSGWHPVEVKEGEEIRWMRGGAAMLDLRENPMVRAIVAKGGTEILIRVPVGHWSQYPVLSVEKNMSVVTPSPRMARQSRF